MSERRTRHPRRYARCYAMFLNGLGDEAILADGITQYEVDKVKVFHSKISTGASYMSLFSIYGIDQSIVKRLWSMYYEFKNGMPVAYDRQLRVNTVFKMLLHGHSHDELLLEGYTDEEIKRAICFLELAKDGAKDKMLMSTLADLTDIPRSSCSHMLKMYRDFMEGKGAEEKSRINYPDQACKATKAQISA